MPQIYIKVSPVAVRTIGGAMSDVLPSIDKIVTEAIMTEWGVPDDDIACSAETLLYVRGDAEVQIEIRYTAGDLEYKRAKAFDPSLGSQKGLVEKVMTQVGLLLQGHGSLSCSAWTKPYMKSVFKM